MNYKVNYKTILLALVLLMLATFAGAQCTNVENDIQQSGPNTGMATTPYSTNLFSATFNGSVTFEHVGRGDAGTNDNWTYESYNPNVFQRITVRVVDHDIPVDHTSSDFYANDRSTGEDKTARSQGFWCGRPYTYSLTTYTDSSGMVMSSRARYIIVNSRTVIFIRQISLNSYDDRPEWLDFEYSLRIK